MTDRVHWSDWLGENNLAWIATVKLSTTQNTAKEKKQ